MSSPQDPDFVLPRAVERERNLLRQIQNALGIETDDPDYDDTANAAIIYNTAKQVQFQRDLLAALSGGIDAQVDVDQITIPGLGVDVFRDALAAEHRIQVYDVSTSGSSDNILTQQLRPRTDHSTFRISVVLDTATTFTMVVSPDNDPNYTADFNQGNNISAGAAREFQFDADPEAQYNFRAGASVTVESLRVQEIKTE